MSQQWLKILGEGLSCSQQQGPSKTAKGRKRTFETRLDGVKADMEERLKEKLCPKEELGNFVAEGIYGRGADGWVIRAKRLKDEKPFALKIVQKSAKKDMQVANHLILGEKELTNAVQFKFIIHLYFVCQDIQRFYFFFEPAPFGSLHDQFLLNIGLKEHEVKWYAAQIILAIEYLHACDIAHRDLKPGNCLLYEDRFLKVSDLGMAKIVPARTQTFVGTYLFMAPEIIRKVPYGKYVDWWSMGVSIYVLLYSMVPFPDIKEIGFEAYGPLLLTEEMDPNSPAFDFCRQLLTIECSRRLGCCEGGAKAIMEHPWFRDISFRAVFSKEFQLKPALQPVKIKPIEDNFFQSLTEKPTNPDPRFEWFDSFCSK